MAVNNFDDWIPEEFDSQVIQAVNAASAVESHARRVPMGTDTRSIPRSAGVDVAGIAKSGTYGEDTSENDAIVLTARKMGRAIRIAEEDMDDSLANIMATKQVDWANSYGRFLDNATLATTGAENGTTVLFTSLYKTLNTTDSDLGYTAAANMKSGALSYANLSDALGLYEQSNYFSQGDTLVIAHTAVRAALRNVRADAVTASDGAGLPIFVQGLAGTPDSLFGLPIAWANGARTSATNSANPGGNPLVIFVNRNYLNLGIRSGPESFFIDGNTGAGLLTDEAFLKMRSRRGFALGHPMAASLLEKTS